ncbi:MAG TPA: antitoxin family protein [Gemmataceae bacterium]|nr:antitoxin family protein [Gemmataceae bacterium]
MDSIRATYSNGAFIPDGPVQWPEGKRVVVTPADQPGVHAMNEDNQGDDPQAIARWIAEFDSIPPLQMTQEEELQWQAARQNLNLT